MNRPGGKSHRSDGEPGTSRDPGRLRPRDLEANADAVAEELMLDGPRTVRGRRQAEQLAARLDERRVPGVLVTSADGALIGYVRREDV